MHTDHPEYLTTAQAANYLNISKQWLETRRCRGGDAPPALRIGRAVRYRRSTLDHWMQQQEQNVRLDRSGPNCKGGNGHEAH